MTEEKKETTEKEALWKQKKLNEALTLGLMVLGAMIVVVWFAFSLNITLINEKHITDPNMPIKDMDNITYTWTAKELKAQETKFLPIMFMGVGVFIAGYAILFVTMSDRKFHNHYCSKIEAPSKYCPDCGIKLSRLERD